MANNAQNSALGSGTVADNPDMAVKEEQESAIRKIVNHCEKHGKTLY